MRRDLTVSHEESVICELRDNPRLAAAYLQAAIAESDEPQALLIALRHIAKAHGMQQVAQRSCIERESLYRALSPKGNPRLSTILAVLRSLDLGLRFEPLASPRTNRRSARSRSMPSSRSVRRP